MLAVPCAATLLPTKKGELRMSVFNVGDDGSEHVLIAKGEVAGARLVPTYIHAECLLGEVLGSLRCECGARLERALTQLESSERGVIVYLRPPPQSPQVASRLLNDGHGRPLEAPRPEACQLASALLRAVGARSGLVVSHEGVIIEELAWETVTTATP